MKYKIDLHIHTNINPHAYSTLEENIRSAINKKMEVIAITNHGPALQDSPHWWSLANMSVIPDEIEGVRILKGVEANILDINGNIDLNKRIENEMDIVLCGLHDIPEYGETDNLEKNTAALINVIRSGRIDVIAHLGNPKFPADYVEVIKSAKENCVAIEINNSSFVNSRKGSAPNCEKIILIAKELGCFLSLGTDSHFSSYIGDFTQCEKLIDKVEYSEELIINSSKEKLFKFLEARKKIKIKRG